MTRAPSDIDLDAVAAFCRGRGAKAFPHWSGEVLRDYLDFHAGQGTLFTVRTSGRIEALGIAWRLEATELWRPVATQRHVFTWTPDNPAGGTLFIAEIAAASRPALGEMAREMARRFPHWPTLRVVTIRRAELHVLKRSVIEMFLTQEI